MANGYLNEKRDSVQATFDVFFRNVPEKGGYAIMAGVPQVVDYLQQLRFSPSDLDYLRQLHCFSEAFLKKLADFKFACTVEAIPEGTPIFPGEPILKVTGPIFQAQLIETFILCTLNHQCLIATKSARIVRAAQGRKIMEFGARRAQGWDASVLGARASYIAGIDGTSCTIAGQMYGIPVLGTMAHSWIQSFKNEFEAFRAYAETYPDNCQLLVDTYNTLKSGLPNAIRTAKEVLEPMGKRLRAIRIDSGDLAYLTIQARRLLDEAGLTDCQITVSNSIDEYLIRDLIRQGAQIDSFGIGERLITSKSEPVFGGVYKLAAIETDGVMEPRMKVSDNPEKITNPGDKEVWRLFDEETGFALGDLITLKGETIDDTKPLEIFDPLHTWKRKTLTRFKAKQLLQPLFVKGEKVVKEEPIEVTRCRCREQLETLWDSVKRFENPQNYYVDLSQKLWDLKHQILEDLSKQLSL